MALNHVSFSQVLLPALVVILAINGKADAAPESPFCSQTNPGEEKILCNNLVNGAPSWGAALSNVINGALKESHIVKPAIDGLGRNLLSSLKPITKDSIVQTCTESFQSLVDDLHKASASIKAKDVGTINTRLSGASSSLSDCTDGMDEFSVDSSEIKKLQVVMSKITSLSLAVASTKP